MGLGTREKGDESKGTRTKWKIKEVLGPRGSMSIMGIHRHEYRGTVPTPVTLVIEVREPVGTVRLFRRYATNPKGGQQYGTTRPSCVSNNRSITKEERSEKCLTGPRGYTRELSQL